MDSMSTLIRSLRARSPLVRRSTADRYRADCLELERQLEGAGVEGPAARQRLEMLHDPGVAPFLTFAPPGHFYSPIPPLEEAARHVRAVFADPPDSLPGIDGRLEAQFAFASELAPLRSDFDPPRSPQASGRYFTDNPAFGPGDARTLQAMLRHLRPKRIVEIGSGYSSALMLDVADEHLDDAVEITFIEPFDELLSSLLRPEDLDRVDLVAEPVQDVDPARFEALEAGDVVFIDSTHVVRAGSDVTSDVFEVLPRLRPGVAVHFHDMFYPFEYPEAWIREGRVWTEAYLLRAFLAYNDAFEIMLFPHQLLLDDRDRLTTLWPSVAADGGVGASLWLRRVR